MAGVGRRRRRRWGGGEIRKLKKRGQERVKRNLAAPPLIYHIYI
jgi:hypothetical protein